MNWKIKNFSKLDTTTLYNLLELRSEVFVVEQNCVYQDLDGKDFKAFHIWAEESDSIIAYARVFEDGLVYENSSSIGRVVVSEAYRKKELGKELMKKAIDFLLKRGTHSIRISAQKHLEPFYSQLGFSSIGKPYLEDGIPHIAMIFIKK